MNPTAGQGRGLRAGVVAARQLRAAGVEVEELTGRDADDLRRRLRRALGSSDGRPGVVPDDGPRVDAVVVVGGDGMVHLGVGLVARTGIPLGIIAAGTGNDVARILGLPIGDPVAAVDVVLNGLREPEHRRAIDAVHCTSGVPTAGPGPTGTTAAPAPTGSTTTPTTIPDPDEPENGRWFVGVLGAGFDALVNERANGWNRPRGRAKYVLAMLRELPLFRPRTYTIDLDGRRWRTAAMLVAVANGSSYGGGMRVAPDARMDDGLLDVMLVRPVSRLRFLTLFPRVYRGTHVSDPRVSVQQGRRVVIDAPGIVAYADGERLGPLPLTCDIAPKAVIILTPRAAETPGR